MGASLQRFETFKPRLRNGKLIARGNMVVFETESPFNQIILPMDMADVITLCSGNYTVKEIIEKIYSKQKSVAFKNVCLTILKLQKQGFLDNGDELEVPDFNILRDKPREWFEKYIFPTVTFTFIKRIVLDRSYPVIFYIMCVGILSTVVSTFSHFDSSMLETPFLWKSGSYFRGLLSFFVVSSILLNFKTLIKFALLAIRTGRVYNVKLELSPIAAYFKIDHEGSHLIDRLNERCLHHLTSATVFIPGSILLAVMPWFSDFSEQIFVIGIGLTLWDLNPFYKSEMSELFRSIEPFDKNNPWFVVQGGYDFNSAFLAKYPIVKQIEYQKIYNFAWSAFTIMFTLKVVSESYPYFNYTLFSNKDWMDKSASVYILYFLGLFLCFGAYQLSHQVLGKLGDWGHTLLRKVNKVIKSIKSKKVDKDLLHQQLTAIPVLSWFKEDILNEIIDQSEVLMFKAGMIVFEEGDVADSLYVLTEGQVRIYKQIPSDHKKAKIQTLKPVSVFGESSLLENQKRLAAAISKGQSTLVKIPAHVLKKYMMSETIAFDLDSFRTSILVDQFFHSAPIFSQVDQSAVQFLMSRGIVEEFKESKVLFHQGDFAHDFYLIVRGSVQVLVNGNKVNTIPQGGFFGEIGVIASTPRTATVVSNPNSVFLKIDGDSLWEFLTQNIEVALMIEAVGEIRLREDLEHHTNWKKDAA